jgi:hypothetical protein
MKLTAPMLALASLFTFALAAPAPKGDQGPYGDINHPARKRCDVEGFTRCPTIHEGYGYPWCGWMCPPNPIRFRCHGGYWVRDDCTTPTDVCKAVKKFGRVQGICYTPDAWEVYDPNLDDEEWKQKYIDTYGPGE